MAAFQSILDQIGNSPLVRLNRLPDPDGADVYVKLETANPGGSVKDRIALAMINEAERSGRLQPGDTLVEPTSGNTGIGLALVAAVKGYKLIITMPEDKSNERRKLMEHLGAQVILTPARKLMQGAVEKAQKIIESNPRCFMPQQFDNAANPAAHAETTGLEIIESLGTPPDCFVSGVGTGGTVSGVGRALRMHSETVRIIAVEPLESQALAGGRTRPHAIQGIGAGFVPKNFDPSVVDEVIACNAQDAHITAKALAKKEGILAGLSAGANVSVAMSIAAQMSKGTTVVTLICDSWERYLSQDKRFGPAPGLDFII